jgi:hypothetical protein
MPAAGETLGARGNTVHAVLNAIGIDQLARRCSNSASWSAELTYSRWRR